MSRTFDHQRICLKRSESRHLVQVVEFSVFKTNNHQVTLKSDLLQIAASKLRSGRGAFARHGR